MSLLINDQTTGHQSSAAAAPHTEPVNQDVDGSNHDDNRLDAKATVQGACVHIADTASAVRSCENNLVLFHL